MRIGKIGKIYMNHDTYEKPLPNPIYPPTDQGSLKAFKYYKNMLENRGYVSINHTEKKDGDPTNPEHLLWMCNHCIPRIRDDGMGYAVSKYSRWLGYIQGCLISRGLTTVEEERDRTRPWFTD